MKRILITLLAVMMLSAAAAAETAAMVPQQETKTYEHDEHVTFIEGAVTDAPVLGFEDAKQVVEKVLDQLGGDARTVLDPWRDLRDAGGNHYFVFQQMAEETTVLGGAVKVITDAEGQMLGLTSSIVADVPEASEAEAITAGEAESLVLFHGQQIGQDSLSILEGATERVILPLALELDIEVDEEGSRYVWAVYTDNPESRVNRSAELPYLAHYVTMDGEYLYSLPTILPGDEAGTSGFDASYLFEFMEAVPYTGYVDLSTGGEMEVTVSVMRDTRTGMYYLGDLERRIAVADCWEYLYNGGRVALEYSPDNLEWDQVGLLSLYNSCRAYDYYKAIGWIGGDGLGTPILILNNYCDINHMPIDNAAYVGKYLGWQLFLASQGNDFSQCLDVLGHEFTHCVTQSVMTYNAYMNDYGAINEAMSDIQGKTCQLLMEGGEAGNWEIGEGSVMQIRSMREPHLFQQPEFTWDLYYTPNVNTPTVLNDQGGVHINSSILNHLAWYLYEKGGMTLEEGRAFWFAVDCAMTPGTDYAQLADLLPWVLRFTGMNQYEGAMQEALNLTQMGKEVLPETLLESRALLTLQLPDNPIFEDEQWIMQIYSVNMDWLSDAVSSVVAGIVSGDTSVLPAFVQEFLSQEDGETSDAADAEVSFENWGEANLSKELRKWILERFGNVFFSASTNAGQDGDVMQMVCVPGHAIPILIHGIYNEKTSDLEETYALAYLGGQWIDVFRLMKETEEDEGKEFSIDPEIQALVDRVLGGFGNVHQFSDVLDLIFYRIEGGSFNVLPSDGLETITPAASSLNQADESEPAEGRKSRPKLEEMDLAA